MKKIMSTDPVVLDLARRLMSNSATANADLDALKAEMTERAEVLKERHSIEHLDIWSEIYATLDIPPGPDYSVDTNYIQDCGVVFVFQSDAEGDGECDLHDMLVKALAG